MIPDPWKACTVYCSIYIFTLVYFALWSVVGLYISHHLLQMEASLGALREAFIYEYNYKSYGVGLILAKIVVIGSSLGLMTCLAIDSWPK